MATFLRFIAVIFAALVVTFLVFYVIAALINYHVPEQTEVLTKDEQRNLLVFRN